MSDASYPTALSGRVEDPYYTDPAAITLYKEVGASKLASVHTKLTRALEKQAAKLEEFSNTPYSREHGELIETTTRALAAVELQLERWHHLIYPNQRGGT